jgi:hypothetical protein
MVSKFLALTPQDVALSFSKMGQGKRKLVLGLWVNDESNFGHISMRFWSASEAIQMKI